MFQLEVPLCCQLFTPGFSFNQHSCCLLLITVVLSEHLYINIQLTFCCFLSDRSHIKSLLYLVCVFSVSTSLFFTNCNSCFPKR